MTRSVRAFFLIAHVLAAYALQWLLVTLSGGRAFADRWSLVHERNARRLRVGFTELRGVFIKLGQVISVLGGFLPDQYREELESLQDQVPPRPLNEVRGRLEEAFGPGAIERFASFSPAPIAAASLAQVHKATTREGREVAVKVLYPGIERLIHRDLFVLGLFLPIVSRVFPIVRFDRVLSQLGAESYIGIVGALNCAKAVFGTAGHASADSAPSQVGLSLFHAPAWMAPTWLADRAATAFAESASSPGSVAMRAGDSVRIMSGRRPLAPAADRRVVSSAANCSSVSAPMQAADSCGTEPVYIALMPAAGTAARASGVSALNQAPHM